jgi:hypothetical protein
VVAAVHRGQTDGAEIWISNSIEGQPLYRVLSFSDGEPSVLRVEATAEASKDGEVRTVAVGDDRYQFADAVITGG